MTKIYKPDGYTSEDQRSDRAFLAGVAYGRNLGVKNGAERVLREAADAWDNPDLALVYPPSVARWLRARAAATGGGGS